MKLSSGKKGPQADKHAIEVNFDFLRIVLAATEFKIPDTACVHHAVLEINADGKLTGDRSRLEAKTWCYDQAQRIHHLISYTIRLCRRSQGTNSYALGTLKTAYREWRGAPTPRAEGDHVIDLTDDVGVCGLPNTDPAPLAASSAQSKALPVQPREDLAAAPHPLQDLTAAPHPLQDVAPDQRKECGIVEVSDDELDPRAPAPHVDIANGRALDTAAPNALKAITASAQRVAPVVPKAKPKKTASNPVANTQTPPKQDQKSTADTPEKSQEQVAERPQPAKAAEPPTKKQRLNEPSHKVRRMKDARWIIICTADIKKKQVLNLMDDAFGGEKKCKVFSDRFAELLNKGTSLDEVKRLKNSLLKGNTEKVNGQAWAIVKGKP